MNDAASETTFYCPFCGASARPTAAFCHRCGRSVEAAALALKSPEPPAEAAFLNDDPLLKTQKLSIESIDPTNDSPETNGQLAPTDQLPPQIARPEIQQEPAAPAPHADFRRSLNEKESVEIAEPQTFSIAEPEIAAAPTPVQPENITAAPAAKPPRPKTRRAVKTEYVWEESTADPTWRFLLFTVAAVIFVAVIFWLARFIR